jgi:hypothetical protein
MSYKINTTDGRLLVDLVDGRIDTDTTDLALVGRNFTGYGEAFNENFIKLLENFANTSPPENPLVGQLWYDKSDGRLKVFNGTQFRSADTTVVSATPPLMLAGDIWVDSIRKQIFFNDGSDTILAGPIYTESQGESGFRVESILDRFGNLKTVLTIVIGELPVAIISREKFTTANVIPGFGREIELGVNVHSDYVNFQFFGPSTSTRQLVSSTGQVFTPDSFFKVGNNNTTSGSISIINNSGITVGTSGDLTMRVESGAAVHRVLNNNQDYKLKVTISNTPIDALTIKTADMKAGFWNSNPQYSLDVNGDLRVSGNILVEGNTTALEVENLRVEDIQIELGVSSDSTLLSDIEIDGAGIVVKSLNQDKTLTWDLLTNSWQVNTNFSIPDGFTYKINGSDILSKTTLSSSVTSAAGLTEVGQLIDLDVADFNIAGSTITTSQTLKFDIGTNIVDFDNSKLTNVISPTSNLDAANKQYVDTYVKLQNLYLTLDITGFNTNPYTEIVSFLDAFVAPEDKTPGRTAYVNTVRHLAQAVTGTSVTTGFVDVDKDGNFSSTSVLQSVSVPSETITVDFSPVRATYTFVVNQSGDWE